MGTTNTELLAQLQGAISDWTTEVGTAQQQLTLQIDDANSQLDRLLGVLRDRNGHALKFVEAQAEIAELKQRIQHADMSADTVSDYRPDSLPGIEAVREDLSSTVDRLQGAIQSWTTEVTQSQEGLVEQFNEANGQLHRLLDVLGVPESRSAMADDEDSSLSQVRHERDVLAAEVHALNIEIETLRSEQESFASANLRSESQRELAQRRELDDLRLALAERDTIIDECQELLEDSQRIESALSEEIAGLETQAAVYAQSEERLQAAVEQQRSESHQHMEALASLTREMGALRQSLLTDSDEGGRAVDVSASDNDHDALDAAHAKIQSLEATLSAFETAAAASEASQAATLDSLDAKIAALEERPTPEMLAALNERITELEHDLETAAAEINPESDASRHAAKEIAPLEAALAERPERGETDALERDQDLDGAMAQLERELQALRERESDSVAAARLVLQELESQHSETQRFLAESNTEREALKRQLDHASAPLEEADANTDLRAKLTQQRQETEVAHRFALEAAEQRIAALEAGLETGPALAAVDENPVQRELLERQASQIQEYRDSQLTAENWIDDLEKQLSASGKAQVELQSKFEALQAQYDAFAGELDELRQLEGTRTTALDEARAEISAREGTIRELKSEIDQLQRALEEKAQNLESLATTHDADTRPDDEHRATLEQMASDVTRLQGELDERDRALTAQTDTLNELSLAHAETLEALETAQQREVEMLAERNELADTLADVNERSSAQQEAFSEVVISLEEQQAALRERDEQIDVFQSDVREMTRQLESLAQKEREAKEQADAVRSELSEIQVSDALHVEELEESHRRLDQLQSEHAQKQAVVDELSNRGSELEQQLKSAQEDGVSSEATVEELQAEVKALQAREAEEAQALEESRSLVESHQDKLRQREEHVNNLESQLATVLAEKELLRETTASQEAEMQTVMAQMSQAITERDELQKALESAKDGKERIFVGEVGAGRSTADAAADREQRMRQQDIVLSELIHTEGNRNLGKILVDADIITREQLDFALSIQAEEPSQLLGTILIENDYTTDDAIATAIACQLDKPVANPTEIHIQPQAIALLNKDVCTWHVCIPLRVTSDRLVVAMANPLDESAIYKIRDVSQREITPVVGAASQIMNAIEAHYGTF